MKNNSNIVLCPDPRSALSFKLITDLQCHCQDIHYVDKIELNLARKRRRPNSLWRTKASFFTLTLRGMTGLIFVVRRAILNMLLPLMIFSYWIKLVCLPM